LPANATLSKYSASIGLLQVGSFALVNVTFEMHNLKGEPAAYRGRFQGTFDIIPGQLSITVVVPFGEPVVTYEIIIDAKFQIGDVDVDLKGHGKLKSVCEELGDLYVTVDVRISNIPVDWLPTVNGHGSFSSNCGDEFILLVEIKFGDDSQKKTISVGDSVSASPPADAKLSFGVHKVGGVSTFSISYTMPLGTSSMTMSIFADVLSTGSFNLGLSLQDISFGALFGSIGEAFPDSDVGGSNPVAGSGASAQLAAAGAIGAALGQGHNLDDSQVASLGGFGDVINKISIKKVLAMFSMLPDGSLALTVSIYGMKIFGLSLEAFVHLVKEDGKWKALVYLGFLDIKNGYLNFPSPFSFLSAAINVGVFILGGGLTKFGFTYATDDIMVGLGGLCIPRHT